jgi:hypothetical protein
MESDWQDVLEQFNRSFCVWSPSCFPDETFEERDGGVDLVHVQFHFCETGVRVLFLGGVGKGVSERSGEPFPEGWIIFRVCRGVSCGWVSFYLDG